MLDPHGSSGVVVGKRCSPLLRCRVCDSKRDSAPRPSQSAGGSEAEPAIYLAVRRGCEARLNRSTWLQLAAIALDEGDGATVASGGETFSLLPA